MLFGVCQLLTIAVPVMYAILMPFTKVEESFGMQATHDLLIHRGNLSQYDHLEFPGVVPRTFVGPIYLALLAHPLYLIATSKEMIKPYLQSATRVALALTMSTANIRLAESLYMKFGRPAACAYLLITCSQFHLMFYSSRTLPNTFALIGFICALSFFIDERYYRAIQAAAFATVVFRMELAIIFAFLFIPIFMKCNIRTVVKMICYGLVVVVVSLMFSCTIDSLFWRRIVWPEGDVWYYNIILNKSSNWGTSPLLWYFYSALPRAMGFSLLFLPFALFAPAYVRRLALAALGYIAIYSALPHKELRFIFYAVALLNVCVAVAIVKVMKSWRPKSCVGIAVVTMAALHPLGNMALAGLNVKAALSNYPAGEAMMILHKMQTGAAEAHKALRIHIDVYCAQNGVTRFLQYHPRWEYNKSESLKSAEELKNFDYLLVGDAHDLNEAILRYQSTHRTLYVVAGFEKVAVRRLAKFPFLALNFVTQPKVAIMERKTSGTEQDRSV